MSAGTRARSGCVAATEIGEEISWTCRGASVAEYRSIPSGLDVAPSKFSWRSSDSARRLGRWPSSVIVRGGVGRRWCAVLCGRTLARLRCRGHVAIGIRRCAPACRPRDTGNTVGREFGHRVRPCATSNLRAYADGPSASRTSERTVEPTAKSSTDRHRVRVRQASRERNPANSPFPQQIRGNGDHPEHARIQVCRAAQVRLKFAEDLPCLS